MDVTRAYGAGAASVVALDRVSLELPTGQRTAIVGRSGSGKSTLLHLAAGIESPTSGEIWVDNREIGRLGDDALTRLRREKIGLVHQFFNLLPTLDARENVALPALLAGSREKETWARADPLLADVGLEGRLRARPPTRIGWRNAAGRPGSRVDLLSPPWVLADEPTGNLDTRSAEQVLTLLHELVRRQGITLVIVTHSREVAAAADRIVELRDGRVVSDVRTGVAP